MKNFTFLKSALTVLLATVVLLGFIDNNTGDDDRPVAIVKRFKPTVSVENKSYVVPKELDLEQDKGEPLFSGDTLITDNEGYALVQFMDNSTAKVKPNSLLIVTGESERTSKKTSTRIDLGAGEIFLEVEPQGNNDFAVATTRSLASVKGTSFGSSSEGFVWVIEGQVDVVAIQSGQTISLFEKMYAKVNETGDEIESGTLTEEEVLDLDEGYEEIEETLIKKQLKLKFKDANGQLREVVIDYYIKGDQ